MDIQFSEREDILISKIAYKRQVAADSGKYLNLDTLEIITKDKAFEKGLRILEPDMVCGQFDSLQTWFNEVHDEVQRYRDKLNLTRSSLINLPNDPLYLIFEQLPVNSVRSLCLVSRRFSEFCDDETLWRNLVVSNFYKDQVVKKPEDLTWRQFFIQLENGIEFDYMQLSIRNSTTSVQSLSELEFLDSEIPLHPGNGNKLKPLSNQRGDYFKFKQPLFGLDLGDEYLMLFIYEKDDNNNYSIQSLFLGNDPNVALDRISRNLISAGATVEETENITNLLDRNLLTLKKYTIKEMADIRFNLTASYQEFILGDLVIIISRLALILNPPIEALRERRFIMNPETNRWIKVGGPTWRRLVGRGIIQWNDIGAIQGGN